MFKSRFIRDAGGNIVGRVDEDDHNSRGFDGGGNFVGRYDRSSDQTYDASGNVVSLSGNTLTALIFGKKRKR
jgi:hypothetical protein